MTRTEERLRDALAAQAGRVRDDRLRLLPQHAPEPRAHRGWLVPVAAALSVLLVVALALTLTRGSHDRAPSGGLPALPAGFPQYLAGITQSGVLIQSTSTGAVITTARTPDVPGWQLFPQTAAAAPDGRTFYIAYQATNVTGASPRQIWIYRLTWSRGGSANSLSWIRGDPVTGSDVLAIDGSMTVSPDGTRLALTAASAARQRDQASRDWPDEIIVLNLRTGARTVRQGGLSAPGQTLTIPGISWAPDSRALVFLAILCRPTPDSNECTGPPGQLGYRGTQVRSLDVTTKGGPLDRSTLRLNTRYPAIASAVAGRNGELTLAVLSGTPDAEQLTVERLAADGTRLSVLYRARASHTVGLPASVTLAPDATGRYLALTYISPDGVVSGWLDRGKLRFLPAEHPVPIIPILAW